MMKRLIKPTWHEQLSTAQRQSSYKCASAILGGRFPDLRSALSHAEFQDAVPRIVTETLESLRSDESAVKAAAQMEEDRRLKHIELFVKSTGKDGTCLRQDLAWLESIFDDKLMTRADRNALTDFTVDEIRVFKWSFELAHKSDRRYWSYRFQYTVYQDLVAASQGKTVQGGERLHTLAAFIFGDAAYCSRQIARNFAQGLSEPPDQGRPTSMPRDVESVLFRFVSMLRSNDIPVYKSSVLDYAMRLLEGTVASLNFALVKDGEYVPSPCGGVEWDMEKLSSWFKRRFIGDRKAGGARVANQVLLDVHRAKWHSYQAMQPYFHTHVQALVDEGIAYYNKDYDEDKKDKDGFPVEPIAFWIEGEEWRAVSFDESRLDDTTHGSGGDRKGRSEQIVRCGPHDTAECIGQKTASKTSSIVAGSNGLGEPVPPWFCLAANTIDDAIFKLGPVAIVNGKACPSQGACNPKGSVNGKYAVLFIVQSLLMMFKARGGLSATRRAVVACDGVGTHMTSEFFEACRKHFIVIVLRTPWCSNRIQFEDLVNFWQMKNCKDVGWYKAKQQAVIEQIHTTGSAALSFARQLELLVPAWNNAFSKEVNLRAWKKGGFGADGITLTPLWAQKAKDSCSSVKERALSKAEQRRGAIEKFQLNRTYEFDKVLQVGPSKKKTVEEVRATSTEPALHPRCPSHVKPMCVLRAQLWSEIENAKEDAEGDEDKGDEDEGDEDEGDEDKEGGSTSTTRTFVCEQQHLRVPATSAAGSKLKDFHDQMVDLSKSLIQSNPSNLQCFCPIPVIDANLPVFLHTESAKAPRVAELMGVFLPEVSYKLMDEGKAHLAHKLENMFNAEPMVVEERNKQNELIRRVIKHKFDAYPKLNPKIREHYKTLFGKQSSAETSNGAAEEVTQKASRPFGFGAFKRHRVG